MIYLHSYLFIFDFRCFLPKMQHATRTTLKTKFFWLFCVFVLGCFLVAFYARKANEARISKFVLNETFFVQNKTFASYTNKLKI